MAKTDSELQEWAKSAAAAGDAETMIIAYIALGEWEHKTPRELLSIYALGESGEDYRIARRLSRLTMLGARRIASRW